ncbi:hypothetical protein LOK49_LG14G00579 [Camellia lanceoleosa]|uniref:Uncharacterized protein n=1 Tax=Camellia lanceoleosa TaxID=1840588 RepID=A0ACC0FDA4_9ERIC|nr:hypothetical protein LOK49_LG14G00579 [Camellia lanceoleosa]
MFLYLDLEIKNEKEKKEEKKKRERELSLEDEDESSRKKVKRIDASEERLQRLENQHIRRKRIGVIDQSSSLSKSESESTDGAVSTSKKAIYGEKLELEFDLMKSMLRASYNESKDAEKLKENMELELVVNNKAAYKVDLLEGAMKRFDKGLNGDGGGGEEVKENDGPRFRDNILIVINLFKSVINLFESVINLSLLNFFANLFL